ncbi:MAG: DUF58 domain-containing protein [Candidatus Brocadiae bacterium]|nr:DUF58 domain-containing protein [Candidatus Brocadiia bacterium]
MSKDRQRALPGLVQAAQSIAIAAWVVAAVSLPATLLLHSYGTTLLIVILVVFWQFLAALMSAVFTSGPAAGRRRFHHKLTGWGLVYCAMVATFCLVSVHWGANLVYLTAAFLMGGAICSAVFPRLMLTGTGTEWDLPQHVFAGDPFSVELTLRNEKRLLSAAGLWVGVDGRSGPDGAAQRYIWRLRPRQEHRMLLRQYLPERGIHRLQPVTVRTDFPFGLLQTSMESRPEQQVLVLPRLGRIHRDVLRRHKGGEAKWLLELRRKDQQGEFRALREYQHGDDPRHIHWPTSARLHKLYVREFERREMHSLLILLDSYCPADATAESRARRERFEKAVSFAATMASLLAERNIFYAFASCCPDLVALPYDQGRGHFFSVLETLALAQTTPERSLADLVNALSFHEVSTGGICLVTPGPLPREESAAALGPLTHCSVSIDVSEPEFDEIFSL